MMNRKLLKQLRDAAWEESYTAGIIKNSVQSWNGDPKEIEEQERKVEYAWLKYILHVINETHGHGGRSWYQRLVRSFAFSIGAISWSENYSVAELMAEVHESVKIGINKQETGDGQK